MKQLYYAFSIFLFLLLSCPWLAASQDLGNTQLIGKVLTEGDEPLPGATVLVKGTFVGTSTNGEGSFVLPTARVTFPLVLSISYVGYETRQLSVADPTQPLLVTLIPDRAATNQLVYAASRKEENILRVPVTVEKVNQTQIRQFTHPDLLNSLTQLKGIDVNVSSMLTNSISTRGFNSASSERLVQLVDYMDIQSPSLNATPGNTLGLPDIDVASIEVLYGPSSALYGANAFNGVIQTNSRDAFTDQGLDVRVRGGQRAYFDGQLRYAQRLGKRWAFKLAGSYLTAHDWLADNYSARQTSDAVLVNNPTGSGLGYDAVNRYGDIGRTFSSNPSSPAYGGALAGRTVFMPGWTERELVADDNHAQLYRVIPTLSYLLTDKVKATASFERAQGTTTLQTGTSRLRGKDIGTNQYRFALEGERWFVRAYQTQELGTGTYDLSNLGRYLQNAIDPKTNQSYSTEYFTRYAQAYNNAYTGTNDLQAQAAAQDAAAPVQLMAGSDAFTKLRQSIAQDNTIGRGAQFINKSILNDVSTQYNFGLGFADLIVGGAYREFRLDKSGILFDTNNGKGVRNYEYGGYAQLTASLLDDHLKLAAAGRLDNFKNFNSAFSPRASAVYSLGSDRQHNFRASYSRAFRSPTQFDQYIAVDYNSLVLHGNVGQGYQGYRPALASNLAQVATSPDPTAALAAYAYRIAPLRLEEVNSYEVGYKGLLSKNLVVDLSYYYSRYRNFVASTQAIISNTDGSSPSPDQLTAAASTGFQDRQLPTRVVVVSRNLDLLVQTQGALASVTYSATRGLNLTGNYSLNVLLNSSDEVPFYNTPKHKFNVGAFGELTRKLGYRFNYHWAQGHRYESNFAAGHLNAYQSVDAQVHYLLPTLHTTLEVGASNLFNTNNVQVYGGPQVGQLIYGGLTVSVK